MRQAHKLAINRTNWTGLTKGSNDSFRPRQTRYELVSPAGKGSQGGHMGHVWDIWDMASAMTNRNKQV